MKEKPYKKFFTQFFKEMANITPKYSGLDKGIIQIRPEERHIYLPHVHFVWNVKKANNEFIKLSIFNNADDIEILEKKNIRISKYQVGQVKEFIILNYDLLTTYYFQAETLDTIEFFVNIKKV